MIAYIHNELGSDLEYIYTRSDTEDPAKYNEYWSFPQRVSSPTTDSPTYEVNSPTSNISSPMLICQLLREPMSKILFRFARQWMKEWGISSTAYKWKNVGSITSRRSGNEPAFLPRMHGWMCEDSLLVLTNQIITLRFLSGINYLVSSDCDPWWQTMWNW